ncbi:MAG: phosphoribosylanthranilate isomerase, partial [Caldilineaceae bacterium]
AKSPRYVAPEMVAEIAQNVRELAAHDERAVQLVGVFVNEPAERVQAVLAQAGLDLAQLHGDEPPQMLAALGGRAYKALRPADNVAAQEEAARYATRTGEDGTVTKLGWMLDAYDPNEYGGTGKKADWTIAATLAADYAGLLLAGGLTPQNVAQAIATVRPWGVDVASGVERAPGQKDHQLVAEFVRAAKSASQP